jgi:HEAT repeat protein
MRAILLAVIVGVIGPAMAAGQEPARDAVTLPQLRAAIDKLGSVDFPVRTDAARTVRRAPAAMAVPVLMQAVTEHADGYVRFRALVLLSGFNDPRSRDVMIEALASPNDRLRTVAYGYFEHAADPSILPRLLDALNREESEFVRPALLRAVAAYGADARAREAMKTYVMKGQDFFRSGVIEALGDYTAAYALPLLLEISKLDGPLQDDAAIAIGKIGDKTALGTLAGLQRTAPRTAQPAIAAAICLLGVNCSSHEGFLEESLKFGIATAGYQELVRNSASGLAAIAVAGNGDALRALVQQGAPTRDPARAAIALAIGTVALRSTPAFLKGLGELEDPKPAIDLLREAFDMLEEDFEEERFFATVRREYWQAADTSPARKLAAALIQALEF